MDEWTQVRWTEARQIAALTGAREPGLPPAGVAPRAHFLAARRAGDRAGAIAFIGHALPRFEAIAWAARILEDEAAAADVRGRERQALDHVLRWLGDPDDDRRRAARDAADDARDDAPERVLALAVFFSGGSISLPDLPAVLPAPELTGRMAAAAVALAAIRAPDPDGVLDRALDLGEKVATSGTRALIPA